MFIQLGQQTGTKDSQGTARTPWVPALWQVGHGSARVKPRLRQDPCPRASSLATAFIRGGPWAGGLWALHRSGRQVPQILRRSRGAGWECTKNTRYSMSFKLKMLSIPFSKYCFFEERDKTGPWWQSKSPHFLGGSCEMTLHLNMDVESSQFAGMYRCV